MRPTRRRRKENNAFSPAGVDLHYSTYVSHEDSYIVGSGIANIPFPTCLEKIPLLTKNKNLAPAQAKYLCMYVVSPHFTRGEKNPSYNTDCQIPPHQARIVAISAALLYPEK